MLHRSRGCRIPASTFAASRLLQLSALSQARAWSRVDKGREYSDSYCLWQIAKEALTHGTLSCPAWAAAVFSGLPSLALPEIGVTGAWQHLLKTEREINKLINHSVSFKAAPREFSPQFLLKDNVAAFTFFPPTNHNCFHPPKQPAILATVLNYDRCVIAQQSIANCRYVVCLSLI